MSKGKFIQSDVFKRAFHTDTNRRPKIKMLIKLNILCNVMTTQLVYVCVYVRPDKMSASSEINSAPIFSSRYTRFNKRNG